jgi:hypothetical protein
MKRKNDIQSATAKDLYFALGIFLVITFVYYCFIANYVLFFQETQFLFIFSGEYLNSFLQKPGGLLEYAARFLSQFYAGKLPGSLILAIILTAPGILLFLINKRLKPGAAVYLLLILIPSFLLLLMQANYFHTMESTLGYLFVLTYYLASLSLPDKYRNTLVIILFPLLYFLAGAYALMFLVMYVTHLLTGNESKQKYFYSIVLLLAAGVSFLVSWKLVFLQPVEQFVLSPLPLLENSAYRLTFVILTGYILFYPVIVRIADRKFNNAFRRRNYSIISTITVFGVAIYILSRIFNPQTARVIELERMVFAEKWEDAIKFHEKKPSRNLIGQYFYNVALSETDQLCERLFYGEQDFLAGSLVLPWGDVHLNRGAYFYYAIGLINEAHRWAYEEMVVYGYRPQNIEMLVKTTLLNGDYRMARRYIHILKKTIFYRGWAKEFEKMADNPELIRSHPELGPKMKILPRNNFFIQFNVPQNNLPLILEGQPDNRKAIDYYLAGLLLTKKVEIAVSNIVNMKGSGYTSIPRHIEEAALMYYNSTRVFPELGGLSVTPDAMARFDKYFTSYMAARNNPATLKENMQKQFGDTFWYYFHFR